MSSGSNPDDRPDPLQEEPTVPLPRAELLEEEATLPPVRSPEEPATVAPTANFQSPPNLNANDNANAADDDLARKFTNYELLGELGRGGMGVVYKARDRKLDRLVALKVVIGGRFASDDEVQRFRLEGEAAAKLDHSNIVPIYDIGEVEGNHFLAMKYIEGSTLAARADIARQHTRAAVELMVKISRAVQHAHERGILHRDLKPGNILLDSEGEPFLTDLGLAKVVGDESGLTQTGFAMGTPGYMPPEQAAGRTDVTTAVDVFALGAILYRMLVGRPPFVGETAMQILMKSIDGDVAPIRSIDSKADSDLDLICRKALAKEPSDRYASASAFANDLQSWLEGETLSVRPPSAVNLASTWIRKNLRSLLASCCVGLCFGLLVGGMHLLNELAVFGEFEWDTRQLQAKTESWASWSKWFRIFPPWIGEAFMFLVLPFAMPICALLHIKLVRPASRDTNVIAGVAAGFLAGLIAMLLGAGYKPMVQASVEKGKHDIEVLANSMWLESEDERELAQRVIAQRYPGINDVDNDHRGTVLRKQILYDQSVGIIPGMIQAVLATTLTIVVPFALSCVLCGALRIGGEEGFKWFGLTFEQAYYVLCSAFCIYSILYGFRSWQMMAACGCSFGALWFAVRRAQIPFRLLAFIALIFTWSLMVSGTWAVNSREDSAKVAKTDDEYRKIGKLYDIHLASSRVNKESEEQWDRYVAAILWLYLGEEDKYVQYANEIHDDFENAYRPQIASRMAKIWSLRPDLLDSTQQDTVLKMARVASEFENHSYNNWFCLTRAMAELRSGNPKEAQAWAQNARDKAEETFSPWYLVDTTFLVDALAQIQLNEIDEAKESLRIGRELFEEKLERAEGKKDGSWNDRLIFRILEREIETKLKDVASVG